MEVMKKISFQPISKRQKPTAHSQRAELLETIITKINAERVGTKYKPVTPIMIAVKLKGIPTGELVGFVKKCSNSGSFGKCFFGCLKVGNPKPLVIEKN